VLCWSQINVENIARLIEEGRMTEHGLSQVEVAKADGRWARAYGSSKSMQVPNPGSTSTRPAIRSTLQRARRASSAR